jgi:hypothetical protein
MPTASPDRSVDRISRGRARLDRWRDRLHEFLERLYDSRAAWVALFLLVTTPLVVARHLQPDPPVLASGSVVPADIVAPETREFVDDIATSEVRQAARAAVRPLYELDGSAATDAAASVQKTIDAWRGARQDPDAGRGAAAGTGEERPPSPAARRARDYLASVDFDPRAEDSLLRALRGVYQRRIVGSLTLLPASGRVTLRDARTGREWDEEDVAAVSLDEARQMAILSLRGSGAGRRVVEALGPFLQDLLTPNMVFNGALTEVRRQEAEARIEPLIVRVPKGKVLLHRGEVAGESVTRALLAYVGAGAVRKSPRALVGSVLLLGILVLFMLRYVSFYRKTQRRERYLFALLVLVTVVALTVDRGFLWLFDHLVDSLRMEPYANPVLYRFMVPLATGAMLITLLVGPRVGVAYTLFYLPLFGMMVGFDLPLLLYCLIGNLAAAYAVTGYRKRTAPIKAGLVLGAVNAAAVLALLVLPGTPSPISPIVFQMACGFGGGVLVAVLVSFLLPLLESAFNILTDVRLLELSNLDNRLLRRLAVEAPGSYNHSVIVGTLAEAAAEAIGANALFCRVAAYYHDVGKLLKPSYFIENQREGDNRHDRLSPHMSALVIASHVKEGYELAKRYGLPQEVLDIIPQHHGTRKINFFYQKALKAESGAPGDVQESDFRYPGPKPQSKEAAIFMLSDSIEAAARTLEDPSPARFKGLIRKIVSDVVLDDQLDQSDLTFSDLEKAETAFLRTLSSIYHHRIDYPGFDFEKIPERAFRGSRTHQEPPPTFKPWGR